MITILKKIMLYMVTLVFMLEPILILPNYVKAEDSGDGDPNYDYSQTDPEENHEDSDGSTDDLDENAKNEGEEYYDNVDQNETPNHQVLIANKLNEIIYPEFSESDIFTFLEKFTGVSTANKNAKIILHPNDMNDLRALYYIGENIPDFHNDLHQLWNILPAEKRPESEEKLLVLKIEQPEGFEKLVTEARRIWTDSESGQKLRTAKALSIITGLPENSILEMPESERSELYDSMFEALKIDLRVLKTLVYLVTPKNQGGAGHWRIKVRRITQFIGRPLSTESDQVLQQLAGQNSSGSTPANCEGMTAAECGQQRRENGESDSEESEPDVTAEDENGDEWEGYIGEKDTEEDALEQRNISAHATGQALDISEVDDIRCTLVKKRRLSGDSYLPQPAKPIKLAWQTNEGYTQSGGNPIDMMGVMKAALSGDIRELIATMGGDITNYEGDLSHANLSDIIGIVGKSLFAEIISSPSHNLSGFDAADTMKNLGSMYFADYFGLPREIFIGRSFNSIDDIEEIIGEAAIEQRLSLPYGSLNSRNILATVENQTIASAPELKNKTVYDLEGTFLNLGQRKLEYEMNLLPGDLDSYISNSDNASSQNLDILIGRRVIEKELSLKRGTFSGDNLDEVKSTIGKFKADLLFKDPTYLENVLHLTPGTSREFLSGKISPNEFSRKVGETRKTDTLNGLRHFAANDSAYNLPNGTWENMLAGKRSAFVTCGSFTLGRLLGETINFSKYLNQSEEVKEAIDSGRIRMEINPDNVGVTAMQQWFNNNLTKSRTSNENACKKPEEEIKIEVEVNITYSRAASSRNEDSNSADVALPQSGRQTLEIPIGEEKARSVGLYTDDLFNMFGCKEANTKWVFERIGSKLLYYGIVNKLLNENDRIKIDLLDTDPEVRTDNPQINFYLDRLKEIEQTSNKIKDDWAGENISDPGFKLFNDEINRLVEDIRKADLNLLNITRSKNHVREIIQTIARLKILMEQEYLELPAKASKINKTLYDINAILLAASEILEGRSIPSADLIKIDQIDLNFLDSNSSNYGAPLDSKSFRTSANINGMFALLARKIDPLDFFIKVGCSRAEDELELPPNALYYLIKNYGENGVKGVDAFYMAIGQAKIESLYTMPEFYFQGPEFGLGMPDFANNYDELYNWSKNEVDTFRALMTTINPDFSAVGKDDFLLFVKVSFNTAFKSFVNSAKAAWQLNENTEKNKNNGLEIVEKTLDDVVENIEKNNFGEGIRDGEKDLFFRLGMPNRSLSSLESGSIDGDTAKRLGQIDYDLGLKPGTTRALVTKQKPKLAKGDDILTSDEKNQIEASLNIRSNTLNTYLKLLNGDIKLSDLKDSGLEPDYNVANPYSQQDDNESCPINFVIQPGSSTKGDFVINEEFLEDDSYCINDQDGRHCFQNKEEAIRYQNEHSNRKYENALDSIASNLSRSIYNNDSKTSDYKAKLIELSGGKKGSVFTDQEYEKMISDNSLRVDGGSAIIPVETIKKIFTIAGEEAPLMDYKKAIGKVEAGRVLQAKLFASLGFHIDSDFFDSGAFYEILNGNFRALYDIGAQIIEQYIGEKTGTVRAIIRAANVNTLNCALSQAGTNLLGNLVGLQSVSIRGNIINNIGQAKIEEMLGLPKSSFHGTSILEAIIYIKPINFAVAFKIPMGIVNPLTQSSVVNQVDIETILGEEGKTLDESSELYRLERVRNFLQSNFSITTSQLEAVNSINNALFEYIPKVLDAYAKDTLQNNYTEKDLAPWNEEVNRFKLNSELLDRIFDIEGGTTERLLKIKADSSQNNNEVITPDEYKEIVGRKHSLKFGIEKLAELIGIEGAAAPRVAEIAANIKSIFVCKRWENGRCQDNPYYQQYGLLLGLANEVFKLDLDQKAGFIPGTIERIFNNPEHTDTILLGQAARILDEKLGMDDDDINFANLYGRFINSQNNNEDSNCNQGNWVSWEQEKQNYDRILNNKDTTSAQKEDARNNIIRINALISSANNINESCKKANRMTEPSRENSWQDITVDWLKDRIVSEIHTLVTGIEIAGERVGVDMPLSDIRQLVFDGELVFMEIAALSMTVNYITKELGDKEAVPAALRISYSDIRNAFFPDSAALNQAMSYATWANMNNEAFDSSRIPYGYGDICPITGDFWESLLGCTNDQNSSLPRGGSNLIDGANAQSRLSYGCIDKDGNNICVDGDGAPIGTNYWSEQLNIYNEGQIGSYQAFLDAQAEADIACSADPNSDSCKQAMAVESEAFIDWSSATADYDDLKKAQDTAKRDLKKMFKDTLQYRLADQMLWKADPNVFPGFSFALMKGNSDVKKAALAQYLKNALMNGKIFGIDIGAIPEVNMWLSVLRQIVRGEENFDNFVKSGGFDQFSNYIGKNFNDWFGFSITPDISKGLLLGIATGHWGQVGNESDSRSYGCDANGSNCRTIPTFAGAVTKLAENKIFSWTDRTLGLPAGTSYHWFQTGKKIYETIKLYNKLSKMMENFDFSQGFMMFIDAGSINNILSTAEKKEILKIAGYDKITKADLENFDINKLKLNENQSEQVKKTIKDSKREVVANIVLQLATEIILKLIHNWFGNALSELEAKLGLVPGSLTVLTDAVVTYGIQVIAHTLAPKVFMSGVGPTGLYIAVAIFILMNLFGVYKVELKCNADGYYWHRDNPQPSIVDVSDLGVWDGLNPNTQRNMSIKAAQYKARKLIQDMLEMQYNPTYEDVIPSQIMTGRNEDAIALEYSIQTSICDKLGTEVRGGICEGTRAGVWANPQTVALTHIGF